MGGSPPEQRPWLVLMTGEPGSGKTTLGRYLADALRLPFLSRDHVRGGLLATAGLWTNEIRTPAPREVAVETFIQVVERMAALGVSAVLEFVVFRDRLEALHRLEAVANCLVVRTTCADAAARADRRDRTDPLLTRQSVLQALGHDSIDSYLRDDQRAVVRAGMTTELHLPLLLVCTDEGYDPPLQQIVDWVIDRTRT